MSTSESTGYSKTVPRRSYTVRGANDDSSSILISASSSSSGSSNDSFRDQSKAGSGARKDTYGTEVSHKKTNTREKIQDKDTPKLGTSLLSDNEKKVAEFVDSLLQDKGSKKSKRERLEDFIRTNASDALMRQMTKIADDEIQQLKGEKFKKWVAVAFSGAVNQILSFGLASELALWQKKAWLFAVLAPIFSEAFAEKFAAQIRRTTYMTDDTKNLHRKQRLISRAFGDLIRQAGGLQPKAKYSTNNPDFKGKKFTAWEALSKDTDHFLAISAHNMINRGVPFLCFTATYLGRDYFLRDALKGAPGWQLLLLRLGAGAVAGSLTALANQFITSQNKDAKEIPGHSTSFWHAKQTYLKSVRQDIRERLNEAGKMTDKILKEKIENSLLDLDKKIEREQGIAKLKRSAPTAVLGELKASMHRSRPEDSLDPEAPGTMAQTIHTALGKMISLICFTYMLDQSWRNENGTESFSNIPTINFLFLPFTLILMGYMWKDDLAIISPFLGASGKSVRDITWGRETYKKKNAPILNDVVTQIDPRALDQPNDDGHLDRNANVNNVSNDADNFSKYESEKKDSTNLSSIKIDDDDDDEEDESDGEYSVNPYITNKLLDNERLDIESSDDENSDDNASNGTNSSSSDMTDKNRSSTSPSSSTNKKNDGSSFSSSSETSSSASSTGDKIEGSSSSESSGKSSSSNSSSETRSYDAKNKESKKKVS